MPTKKQVDHFLSDPNYLALLDAWQENRLLFITEMTETRLSAVLAWLFKPYEGHGLGDKALRAMLLACWRQMNEDAIADDKYSFPRPQQLTELSFRDLIVRTEYPIPIDKRTKKSGKIDLLMISHVNKMVIAVENKFGAGEHGNQLNRYFEFVEKTFLGYTKIYIYLDRYLVKEPESRSDSWLAIDYDWMLDLVRRQQDAQVLSEQSLNCLSQVCDYLESKNYASDTDEQAISALIEKVCVDHTELVKEVRQLRKNFDWKNRFEKNSFGLIDDPLRVTLMQYPELWSDIFDQSNHATLIRDVRAHFYDAVEIEIYPKEVFFRIRSWARFDDDQTKYWGPRVLAEKNRDTVKDNYSLSSGISFKNIKSAYEPKLREAVTKLRNLKRAASSTNKWVSFHKSITYSDSEIAKAVIAQLSKIDAVFKNINEA